MKRGIWLILVLVLSILAVAEETCQDKCVSDTFYKGNFDNRAGICNYETTKCEYGCNEQGCLPPTITEGRIRTPQTGITRTIGEDSQNYNTNYRVPDYTKQNYNTNYGTPIQTTRIQKETTLPKIRQPIISKISNACETPKDCYSDPNLNLCTHFPICIEGVCEYIKTTPPDCDDSNICTQDTCNPKTGKCESKPEPDGKKVEGWKYNDCHEIYCKAGEVFYDFNYGEEVNGKICQCSEQEDCAKLEDGDFCNGTLYCDKSEGICKVNPATIIQCYTGDDNECRKNTCTPETGKCEMDIYAGETCDSGVACHDAACSKEGVCVTTNWNPQKKTEKKSCECWNNQDCAKYEDGNVCNGTLFCNKATTKCQLNPATQIYCPTVDDTACKTNTCNPITGKCEMKSINEGNTCYDTKCFTGICTKGECPIGWNNKCQCAQDKDCGKYDDGDVCNGVMYCDKKEGICKHNPATEISCYSVDDNACRKNTCNPITGKCEMKELNEGNTCYDSKCFTGICTKGECPIGWNNKCQCRENKDCEKYEDGNSCNGTLYCDKVENKCVVNPATIVDCLGWTNTECVKSACNPLTAKCETKKVC